MQVKYEVFIFYSSKVNAKVNIENRQTNRQDKNHMPSNYTILFIWQLYGIINLHVENVAYPDPVLTAYPIVTISPLMV